MLKSQSKPVLITMGDHRGVGPEVIVKALLSGKVARDSEIKIIGLKSAFESLPGFQNLMNSECILFEEISESGEPSWNSLKRAVEVLKENPNYSLVTGPVSKDHLSSAGFGFPGQTDYLAHEFHIQDFAMMLFHERMKVVLTTIHLPLREIFSQITSENIYNKLTLIQKSLQCQFQIENPKVAVCGLNPHAGENGLLGFEEREIIEPALRKFQEDHDCVFVTGPVSADVVFHQALQGDFDAVLCHYHDQALIPLKTTGFYESVNMTLGLSFVRTSPDHGTAFDIAGQNKAKPESMIAAIQAAQDLQRGPHGQ